MIDGASFIVLSKLRKQHPKFDDSIQALLSYDSKYTLISFHKQFISLLFKAKGSGLKKRKYFWDDEIEAMINKVESLKRDVKNGVPNAQKTLDDFEAARKDGINVLRSVS